MTAWLAPDLVLSSVRAMRPALHAMYLVARCSSMALDASADAVLCFVFGASVMQGVDPPSIAVLSSAATPLDDGTIQTHVEVAWNYEPFYFYCGRPPAHRAAPVEQDVQLRRRRVGDAGERVHARALGDRSITQRAPQRLQPGAPGPQQAALPRRQHPFGQPRELEEAGIGAAQGLPRMAPEIGAEHAGMAGVQRGEPLDPLGVHAAQRHAQPRVRRAGRVGAGRGGAAALALRRAR